MKNKNDATNFCMAMPNWSRINKFQPTLLAKFCIHNFATRLADKKH